MSYIARSYQSFRSRFNRFYPKKLGRETHQIVKSLSPARCNSMSRLARLVRLMHTDGRRVPHPNQGGAGTASPVSPSISSHIPTRAPPIKPLPAAAPPPLATSLDPNLTNPDTSAEGITRDGDLPRSPPPKREFTRLGKLVIRRPRRTIPVTLPSGHPEPSTYPPPPEYYEHIKSLQEIRIHPLWQFFHTPPTSRSLLDKNLPHPPFAGFGSIIGLDDLAPANLIQSGMS